MQKGIFIGAYLGARTGIILSAIYGGLWIIVPLLFSPVFSLFMLIGFTIFALIPSIFLGLLAGSLIGWLLERFDGSLSGINRIILGVEITLPIAICINLLFKNLFDEFDQLYYWYFLGIPSLIYVIAGGWGGWQGTKLLHDQGLAEKIILAGNSKSLLLRLSFVIIAGSIIFIGAGLLILNGWIRFSDQGLLFWAIACFITSFALGMTGLKMRKKLKHDKAINEF